MLRIYVDHAATTPMRKSAVSAMQEELLRFGNPSGLHRHAVEAAERLRRYRQRVAEAIGALPEEIVLTSGGSESDNQAIFGAAELGRTEGKTHFVTTAIEHPAVFRCFEALRRTGIAVTYVRPEKNGIVSPGAIAEAITEETALVSVMYANHEIGTIQPIEEIAEVCRRRGVLFHTDAVQAAGHLPISLLDSAIDLLSLSAHKFGGPHGIGLLYVRKGLSLPPHILGGVQEGGRRAGTENLPALAGMAAALAEAVSAMPEEAARARALRDRLMCGLLGIPGAELSGDPQRRLPGNLHLTLGGIQGEGLVMLLDLYGISASAGSACSMGRAEASRVLLALGHSEARARAGLRLTLSHENEDSEIDEMLKIIPRAVEDLRRLSDTKKGHEFLQDS